MSVDYFLKFEGVPGESNDAKHKGEIELLSFSWGATQAGSMSYGGGGGTGKVDMQDFSMMKAPDKASPTLFLCCATGEHIKKAVLTCRKAGKTAQEYMKWTFDDLLVTSYQISGSAGGDTPTESVSLNFSKVKLEYAPQKADGSLEGYITKFYDQKQNKGG